jgi:hypothetical protein
MPLLMVFNELPCSEPHPQELVDTAMTAFVQLLQRVSRLRNDVVLVSGAYLTTTELAPGYYFADWAHQPRHVDLARAIRNLRQRAPFTDVLPPGAGDGVDYFWEGRPARALGAAHLLDGLLVSVLVDDRWDTSWVRADRQILVELDNGEADIRDADAVDVRHAAAAGHLVPHEDWIKHYGLPDLRHGDEIWDSRESLYPSLQFLPHVQRQLHGLTWEWVVPVALELRRIDDAVADWNPQTRPLPVWRSLVTPEHEMRKELCRFTDFDGQERVFDWHGRFTPGKGRIHFRLVAEQRKARIAYVGPKL